MTTRAGLFVLLFAGLLAGFSPVSPATAQNKAQVQRSFDTWLQTSLKPDALKSGISDAVFSRVFGSLKLNWKIPDLVIPGSPLAKTRAQSQAEFRSPAAYFSEANLKAQTRTGRALLRKWSRTLSKIEQRYGIPAPILLAIWGRESAFGKAKIPYSAVRVLATKAFMSTRKELFRGELIAALTIIEQGVANSSNLKSSWAGAMGQPQFMPSSFLKYAIDFDGDGKKDIWNSIPDTLASMANYLAQNGWDKDNNWGIEVRIPASLSCANEGPDRARTYAYWNSRGVKSVSGGKLTPSADTKPAMMLVPAGRKGPHFIVTGNFYTIKKYNNSDLYALYVGNLADRIGNRAGPFKSAWQPQKKMLRSQIATMQRKLEQLGYDVGGADGLPGFRTRRSIGEWQISTARHSTCFPDLEIINLLQ